MKLLKKLKEEMEELFYNYNMWKAFLEYNTDLEM